MALWKFLRPFGATQAPQICIITIFLSPPKAADCAAAPKKISWLYYRRRRQLFPKWAPKAARTRCRGRRYPGSRGKRRRRRLFWEYIYNAKPGKDWENLSKRYYHFVCILLFILELDGTIDVHIECFLIYSIYHIYIYYMYINVCTHKARSFFVMLTH